MPLDGQQHVYGAQHPPSIKLIKYPFACLAPLSRISPRSLTNRSFLFLSESSSRPERLAVALAATSPSKTTRRRRATCGTLTTTSWTTTSCWTRPTSSRSQTRRRWPAASSRTTRTTRSASTSPHRPTRPPRQPSTTTTTRPLFNQVSCRLSFSSPLACSPLLLTTSNHTKSRLTLTRQPAQ